MSSATTNSDTEAVCPKCQTSYHPSLLKKHQGMCKSCGWAKIPCPTCHELCRQETLAKYITMCSKCFQKRDLFCKKCSRQIKSPKSRCFLEYNGLCEKCHNEEWLKSEEHKKSMNELSLAIRESYLLHQQHYEQRQQQHEQRQQQHERRQQQQTQPPPTTTTTTTNTTTFQFSRLQQKDCPICLASFEENDEIKMLSCLHYYHSSCYAQLLTQTPNAPCPTCRQ